ncbi:iron complex outermembrane recepter protein [Tenacibaculum sp. MAR_2009_124]|uniref:TonB-dependent receptor n=1 Tax=Tenacibaculum sp. MAR_2009_124 TaxID=1250059 RepID=UPI0008996B52|nr:TonB-dependent receptor [Tenacibaculum sp. MAR_2009_124]SEB41766.1 iron complex outermembrane recepter protein [Tenacibaculum sp. MAR_2009_124]
MNLKSIVLILLVLFSSIVLKAQNCKHTFSGLVEDFHDKSPIIGATIFVKNLNKYATTDTEGKFSVQNICSGKIVVEISHLACETQRFEFNITKDLHKIIDLEHHLEELNEINVKSEVRKETETAQETVVTANTLEKFTSLSLGDALKEVSGVSSINTGNSIVKPMINGMLGSRISIINNNVRLQDQEWGIEHAPNVDVNSANTISVIKGSGALAYSGDAIGGVVLINPSRIIKNDTLYGQTIFGMQTNGMGYNTSTKLNKSYSSGWFAQIQGSYKANGDFNTPNYNLTNTGANLKGLTARFGKNNFESGFEVFYSYLNSQIGILRGSAVGNVFDLARAIETGIPSVIDDFRYSIDVPKQDITHHLMKANYYKRFKNFGKLSLQYDYQHNQRFEFDVRRGDLKFIPAIDLTLQTHSVLADLNLDSNSNRKYNFGIMARYQDNFADPTTGVRRLIPDYNKYDIGFYATTEWQLNENVTADAAIRYDFNRIDAKKFYRKFRWEERGYNEDFSNIIIQETGSQYLTNPVFDYHNISASLGTKVRLNDNSFLITNYALTNRPPNPAELFSDGLHHSAARYELGDLRFDKEVSNRFSASYKYNSNKIYFLTEVFYNNINDYIYLKPFDFIETIRGPYPIWEYKQTNAQLFGVDITVNYDITKNLEWQNNTAFIKGYESNNTPLIDIPPFTTINKIKYSNENWNNFSATLKSEWVFEQNEWPDFNFTVVDRLTNEEVAINISNPPPAYHLLHFNSEATFPLSKNTSLNINFGVNNIFNTNYRNYLNQLRFFANELGRNYTLQFTFKY